MRSTDKLVFRARRDDPTEELEIYQMNFRGRFVGQDPDYQVVRKIVPLSDGSIALLNGREICIADLSTGAIAAYYSE